MSLATNVFPCLPVGFLVWKQMHDLRRKLFLLAALPMWEAYAKEFFFLSRTLLMKEVEPFFYYVLDIWMDLISDLVTNGLARLDLPLELIFLCIEQCQKIYHSIFLMRASHVIQLFVLFWSCDFPCIIFMKMLWLTLICGGFLVLFTKFCFFLDFLRHHCKPIAKLASICEL